MTALERAGLEPPIWKSEAGDRTGMAADQGELGVRTTGGKPRPTGVVQAPADGPEVATNSAERALGSKGGEPEGGERREAITLPSSPLSFCARLWCLCTKRPYDSEHTESTPEFLDFIARTNRDTPAVTPLFDVDYYAEQISWQSEPINYLLHYCQNSTDVPLHPHVLFDSEYVLSQSDMVAFDRPPLLYFMEKHDPAFSCHPLFDPDVYVTEVGEDFLREDLPIVAFISRWAEKPASFSRYFSRNFYSLHEPVVRYGQLNPLVHFMSMPPDGRRDPNPMFHREWYMDSLAEDNLGATEPLVHYIRHGLPKGLMPNPFARSELQAASLGLAALVEALRRYLSFPAEPVVG
ncbi:MAG: hypothetical protein ABI377_00070 [Devosia sp.]